MAYRSEFCLVFQGKNIKKFKKWLVELGNEANMKKAANGYCGDSSPYVTTELVRDLISYHEVLMSSEDKIRERSALQFYNGGCNCHDPWDMLLRILEERADELDIGHSYARLGEDSTDSEYFCDGPHICVERRIMPPFSTTTDKPVRITLELTEEEWGELAYSVESKAEQVKRGDYGDQDPDFDPKEWERQLRGIYNKIVEILGDRGVCL